MITNGVAGADPAKPVGALAGEPATAYVWPTSLDPASVGFEEGTGILALAAANHPDFDDTPLFDENADGDVGNNGGHWHTHWVVLTPTPECGDGALAVRDIPEGSSPKLPATWPGLPIFLDSPGYAGNASDLIAISHIVAINFQTVSAANKYWNEDPAPIRP
jgi:hypothetical protein